MNKHYTVVHKIACTKSILSLRLYRDSRKDFLVVRSSESVHFFGGTASVKIFQFLVVVVSSLENQRISFRILGVFF
jgi:hypothetical protein